MSKDTLMFCSSRHPSGEPWGMPAHTMPDIPHRSDTIAAGLLVCFLLLFFIRIAHHESLKSSLSAFFLPSNSSHHAVDSNGSEWKRIIVALLFSLQGAICVITVTNLLDITPPMLSSWLLSGIYTVLFFLFIVCKQLLYHFVHSVFFSAAQQGRWRKDYSFLITAETLLLFPLLLVFVYLQLDLKIVLISGFVLLLFVKILLLFKCFSTFFENFYGILHLFVYFCTLEAAPLVVLWTILVEITQGLHLI